MFSCTYCKCDYYYHCRPITWSAGIMLCQCLFITDRRARRAWQYLVSSVVQNWVFTALLCKRCLCCHAVSVRPSVCPSDTFVDHVKTNKHIFEFFSPSVATPFYFFYPKGGAHIPTGSPVRGASNARGYDKITIFHKYFALYQKRL